MSKEEEKVNYEQMVENMDNASLLASISGLHDAVSNQGTVIEVQKQLIGQLKDIIDLQSATISGLTEELAKSTKSDSTS